MLQLTLTIHRMAAYPNRLRELREARGLKLAQVSREAGLSDSYVSRLERGERQLSVARLAEFARILGCSEADIVAEGPSRGVTPAEDEGGFEYAQMHAVDTRPWSIMIKSGDAGYSPTGCAWFGQAFLEMFDLDPSSCLVILVFDDAMAPDLPRGSNCLVDSSRKDVANGGLYAIEHSKKLLIRRALVETDKRCFLADQPGHAPIYQGTDTLLVGPVVWAARLFNLGIDASAALKRAQQ